MAVSGVYHCSYTVLDYCIVVIYTGDWGIVTALHSYGDRGRRLIILCYIYMYM